MAVFVDFDYDSMIFYFENFIGRGHITQKTSRNAKLIVCIFSGVARGVAGVAEATPIIQFLFNKFGQKIRVKKSYLL